MTASPLVCRRWELESATDAWQIPRTELELGQELGHGFFGTVNKGIWRNQVVTVSDHYVYQSVHFDI